MKKKLLTLIVLIALIVVTSGPLLAGEIKSITLDITGMTCKICPKAVNKAISSVNGVKKIDVNYKEKEAHVKYDVDETDIKEIITAVKEAGYGANPKIKGP